MSVLSRLSAAGLALALVAGVPATAHATASASLARLGAGDRFGTAVAISKDVWDDKQAQSVVLARSDAFPDALAGTPLATRKNGPLLLTPSTSLHGSIAAELRRVLPRAGTSTCWAAGPRCRTASPGPWQLWATRSCGSEGRTATPLL
jgi:hypothetical protein